MSTSVILPMSWATSKPCNPLIPLAVNCLLRLINLFSAIVIPPEYKLGLIYLVLLTDNLFNWMFLNCIDLICLLIGVFIINVLKLEIWPNDCFNDCVKTWPLTDGLTTLLTVLVVVVCLPVVVVVPVTSLNLMLPFLPALINFGINSKLLK